MDRPDPLTTARTLVGELVPGARQAWLSGSVVTGRATPTSDLDVVVLQEPGAPVHRESLERDGWPVELFVHTPDSVRAFVASDLARRQPTMPRLIATGVPLLGPDELGAAVRAECEQVLAAGPAPLPPEELARERYALTDLVDDLRGGGPPEAVTAVAVQTWLQAGRLLLLSGGRWTGNGTWLARELASYDEDGGTAHGPRLHAALLAGVHGEVDPLVEVSEEILERVGGRLWVGYRASPRSGS